MDQNTFFTVFKIFSALLQYRKNKIFTYINGDVKGNMMNTLNN